MSILILQLIHGSMAPSPDHHQESNVSGSSEKQITSKSCILCGNTDKQMSRYKNWGPAERKFLSTHFPLETTLSEDSQLCKSHLVEVKRHHNNPDYIPKWSTNRENVAKPVQRCINPMCIEPQQQKLIRPAEDELKRVLGVSSSSVYNSILLCQHCYNEVCR